jgi:2-haloacid dehalogenase
MLKALIEHARLSRYFDAILSVDELKTFKPHPSVYGLATRHLGLNAENVGFVSSNFLGPLRAPPRTVFRALWSESRPQRA